MDSYANAIIQHGTVEIDGVWQRHVPARFKDTALEGRTAPSRWATGRSFPLLHLGRPRDSVIVEAYRHIVDPVEDPALAAQIIPRRLVTCEVAVTNVFDLRTSAGRVAAGLTMETLTSATSDRAAWSAALRRLLTDDAWHARQATAARQRMLPTWRETSQAILGALR